MLILLPMVSGLRVPTVNRRDILSKSAVLAGATCASPLLPAYAAAPDYAGAKASIQEFIKADENVGPTLLRLAWHSSGTYDKIAKNGGSGGGTIRFKEELAHGGNAGLDKMVALLEPEEGGLLQNNPLGAPDEGAYLVRSHRKSFEL